MKYKAFYISGDVEYRETEAKDARIQKLYEIRNSGREEIMELPTGCTDIRCLFDGNRFRLEICPSLEAKSSERLAGFLTCVGIRLRPGVRLAGQVGEEDRRRLLHRMTGPLSPPQKLAALEEFLGRGRLAEPEYPVNDILELVERQRGSVNVEDLAAALSCSRRYLEVAFKRNMGIPIKKYAGIVKLQNALVMLAEGRDDYYGGLAYYDQSHFIREFKKYMSVTPGQYRRNMGWRAVV